MKICFSADSSKKVRVVYSNERVNYPITVVTSACIDYNLNIDIVSSYDTKFPADVPIGSVVICRYEPVNVFVAIDVGRYLHGGIYLTNLKELYTDEIVQLLNDLAQKFFGLSSYPRIIIVNDAVKMISSYRPIYIDINDRVIASMYYASLQSKCIINKEGKEITVNEERYELTRKLLELAKNVSLDQELELE